MTDKEVFDFRADFKGIVYLKGLITAQRNHITKLHIYDKNGSHSNAIERAISKHKELKKQFADRLGKYGCTYDELLEKSKKLSAICSRIKASKQTHYKSASKLTAYKIT